MTAGGSPVRRWLRAGGEAIVDAVWPKRCAGCDARGDWVCALCADDLRLFAEPWCDRCGIPPWAGTCRCADLPSEIAAARAVGSYALWLGAAIRLLKFEDEPARAAHLGSLLAARIAPFGPGVLLCPVPLHPRRERRRGYNQAALVAAAAAAVLAVPSLPLLTRVRDTPHQVTLGAAERRANVAGAFAVTPTARAAIAGATVVLIDDVLTTGSTLTACAVALHAAGPARVFAATIAREL